MMNFMKMIFFYFLFYLLSLTIAFPQVNFHRTTDQSNTTLEYNCFYVPVQNIIKQKYAEKISYSQRNFDEIISLCLTESLSKWNIQPNPFDQKLTFDDLRKENITSEQLYTWSASIDLIEQYEEYLMSNQLLLSMSNHVFYNCTSPRFGELCQYEFIYLSSPNSTLNEIIFEFYELKFEITSLTCYEHLKCDRGSKSLCLDWTEICDGIADCIGNYIDEDFCWKIQINECEADEYRCPDGQCISKQRDYISNMYSCLDPRNIHSTTEILGDLSIDLPIIYIQDVRCPRNGIYHRKYHTNPCDSSRQALFHKFMLEDKSNTLSNICHLTFYCARFVKEKTWSKICQDICDRDKCTSIINQTCPQLIVAPAAPIASTHIYAAYKKEHKFNPFLRFDIPQYICYNTTLCQHFRFNDIPSTLIDEKTCFRIEDVARDYFEASRSKTTVEMLRLSLPYYLDHCDPIVFNDTNICNSVLMFRCPNSSKCISIYRVCNGYMDCFDGADELQCSIINGTCSPIESYALFKCPLANRCISLSLYGDNQCNCPSTETYFCEDEPYTLCDWDNFNRCDQFAYQSYIRTHISFPTICDGFQELHLININGTFHSDESQCQYWKCNNMYTRCNGFWNCFDGSDEIGCNQSPLMNCSSNHHLCIQPVTFQLMCLPLEKANDGDIDCLGATDEPTKCRLNTYEKDDRNFYCDSIMDNARCVNINYICSSSTSANCLYGNKTIFCNQSNHLQTSNYCSYANHSNSSYLVKYFCSRSNDENKAELVHFSVGRTTTNEEQETIEPSSIRTKTFDYNFECHRGYPLRLWLDTNRTSSEIICLCPLNFYGVYCQFQNERISAILQFETYLDSLRSIFSIIISVIDDTEQRLIHSSKQITYSYFKHCSMKFNFYLTYSTRPKYANRMYSIHIDVYNKLTFEYRGGLFIPIKFPFLPVYRIANIIKIPQNNRLDMVKCSKDQSCVHGQCMKYAENTANNRMFCHCHPGWTGKDCSIAYNCKCSPDSLCAGIEATTGRSICICPLNRWGLRCFLRNNICYENGSSVCLNNGQCVLTDDNLISEKKFFCLCQKGFSGDRCEINDAKIILSFDENILLTESILLHFIEIRPNTPIRNGSTFQSIPLYHKQIIIRWSHRFHIVFGEFSDKTYYLIHIDKDYNRSRIITKLIRPSDRCYDARQYLNETILNSPLIHRIKYYHVPCQYQISCFYDRDHFCLCNDFSSQRIANCFEFNSDNVHNCFKLNNCQNNGQCLQDNIHCPQTFRCVCPKCFYGSLCQFQSSLFDMSFDGIIGSHIQVNQFLYDQPLIIQITLAVIILMVLIGFLNGILSLLTFQSKQTRLVGCGYYLLGSTMTTFFTSFMLALKFTILLTIQMSIIRNRTFVNIQCYSLDYLLQVGLNTDRWLNACVAIERAFNVIKGIDFNKAKSKQIAKYAISFILLMTITSTIYDPIYRQIVDDESNEEQKRVWCIVSYSSQLLSINQSIQIFHFFVPYFINVISSFLIIILSTKRRRLVTLYSQSYQVVLYEQLQRHRYLLIAPLVLVILSIPRIILSFVAGCMKSDSSPWLYLIGYLISFVPPMLTFVIFVLPSKLYKEEFRTTVSNIRKTIQLRIFRISTNN